MAKSRKDREEAERRARLAATRIWPVWAQSLGAMIQAQALVRFACPACRRLYDMDLESLAMLRGRAWSLIDRRARCKASKCRTPPGHFAAAPSRQQRFLWLAGAEPMPDWLIGTSPADHEPPPPPPPLPPTPPGVDPVRWAWADERERKRMVRQARG